MAEHRDVQLARLSDVLRGYGQLEQSRWVRWRAKNNLEPLVPDNFTSVLEAVCAIADPVLSHDVGNSTWRADSRTWERQAR